MFTRVVLERDNHSTTVKGDRTSSTVATYKFLGTIKRTCAFHVRGPNRWPATWRIFVMFSNPGSLIWMWILVGNAVAVVLFLNMSLGNSTTDIDITRRMS